MKRILKLFLFIFFGHLSNVNANHIVGGEIEMIHIGNENSFTYRVKLIQYFDCAQTANPGPDDLISYTIFRKSDGQAIRNARPDSPTIPVNFLVFTTNPIDKPTYNDGHIPKKLESFEVTVSIGTVTVSVA